ncbi:Dihydroneopterin aldolase [Corynebacterium ulcerans]|uniref:7,8-dihydroneopterin aldolase n=1 Tax=Corynebacterium ramonii TaxID=3026968 RepID=A0ABN4EIS1_9CORY|nr:MULTISPECIES: dihydroneopterin aldolase [Corynebacterium]AIU31249.1 Dihydroneopterin aldolase [Corynebacterium ulcerans]AIU33429.1 Dihydroneopterin aldolase [Corynebacterium ramonii FRC0011]AIU92519.1 Dihydroneopterin aldolase [Corynebacterium ulcerans]ESU57230.1 dihydroneopterin aldolase [Corynebacterium ulcerans NCTC 12077]MBH5302213.1 dihydroneopterin aldolase [Corynebacterium ulcerans]
MDRIELKGLKGYAYHGVFEHEKREGQEFLVDITCWLTFPTQDDLTQTVHYGELAQLAYGILTGEPRDLIETVASEIADTAMSTFPLSGIEVTVHKPHAPIPLEFADVAVVARR